MVQITFLLNLFVSDNGKQSNLSSLVLIHNLMPGVTLSRALRFTTVFQPTSVAPQPTSVGHQLMSFGPSQSHSDRNPNWHTSNLDCCGGLAVMCTGLGCIRASQFSPLPFYKTPGRYPWERPGVSVVRSVVRRPQSLPQYSHSTQGYRLVCGAAQSLSWGHWRYLSAMCRHLWM